MLVRNSLIRPVPAANACLAMMMAAALPLTALAAQDPSITIVLEDPVSGKNKSGVGIVRGWAVSHSGIGYIQMYIDGVFSQNLPFGAKRTDVCAVFPSTSYHNSCFSGYTNTINYAALSTGPHTMKIRAYNRLDDYNEVSASFSVSKFNTEFVSDESSVYFTHNSQTELLEGTRDFQIRSVRVNNECYDMQFGWNEPTQDWEVTYIVQTPDANCLIESVAGGE